MYSNGKKVNNNTNREFVRLALILVLILILGFVFLYTWLYKYNVTLRNPYILKGNIFLMIIYMVLVYIFMIIYDCINIHENRMINILFSESLAVFSCNILVYFVMIIPAAAIGLMPFTPIVYLSIKDFIIILLWGLLIHYVDKKLFPPSKILIITNENSIDEILFKFSKRNDVFDVADKIIFNNNFDEVLNKCENYDNILIGDITSEERNDIIKNCFDNSRNIFVIPKISDILLKYSDDMFVLDTPIFLSSYFGLSIELKFLKRIVDIIVSIFVIIVFIPLWLIIALLIKIEDGGPIFFIQNRVTINKKIFKIYKFRSMKVSNSVQVLPTGENDDRITKIGKFIRKFHIDEVPQFINILIGDMSVVGPRPERIEHVELYSKQIKEFEYRLKVKAGLTGLAQIYGKYNTSAIDKLKLDLIYIKKCNLIFDIEMILRTFNVFFAKDNTEGFDSKTQEYIKNNA